MTTTPKPKPKPKSRQITGVCGTDKYLQEPKLGGALLRLRADRADFSRVDRGVCKLLLNHNRESVVGRIKSVSTDSGAYRFAADVPETPTRSREYLEEYDAGIRGTFSIGFAVTDLILVGRNGSGQQMYDGSWMLTEVSDETVPSDPDAVADVRTEDGMVRLSNGGWIRQEVLDGVRGADGFGDVSIHPQGRVPKWDPIDDVDLGKYARVLLDPRQASRCRREVAWMERNLGNGYHVGMPDGGPMIPFALLARCGPAARARADARAKAGVSPEQHLERYMDMAETALHELAYQASMNHGVRTLTQADTSAGALTGIMVDVAHSIMWLTEMDDALEMMTVVPGLVSGWQSFYGNVAPAVQWPGEGANLTEQTPTMVRLLREPKTMGLHFAISTAAIAGSDQDLGAIFEQGCREVVQTQLMRAALSGNDVADMFAEDTNSFSGLMNSGITETNFGAAITDLGRQDLIDARRRLFTDQAKMNDLGWLLSEPVAKQLEITARSAGGGSDYLYQDGMVDSGAYRLPARESLHLGKTGTTAPAVLLEKSCALVLVWGQGIAVNRLQIPGKVQVDFDLQIQASFALLDPRRAEVIKQG